MRRREPIVLTQRGEKVMLVVSWLTIVLVISFAEKLANLFN